MVTLSTFISNSNLSLLDFIMLCATFFMVMITYIGRLVVGLILCSIIIFIYASYIFYMNLDKEISKAKRHNTPCTFMMIKLLYYKEIKNIIGKNKTDKLIKEVSEIILNSTRNEDDSYTLENDTLAIVMPVTDLQGATIVKNRIKERITELNLDLRSEKEYVNVDAKISMVEYRDEIRNSMEFKLLAEEELQYDV